MNWGQGIAVFLTIFVLFILGLVYMTTSSTFDLQAEDYYKQEIEYQDRIDALARGKQIESAVELQWRESAVILTMDDKASLALNGGVVEFFRPNDSSLDRKFNLLIKEGEWISPIEEFTPGKYEVLIRSSYEGEKLAIKKELMIR